MCLVEIIDLLGNNKGLLRVETEELLDALAVVSLERVTVNTTGALKLGAETNGGGQLDDGGFVGDLAGLADSILDALEVVVTVLDGDGVPAIGLETLGDILGESALGVTILFVLACFPHLSMKNRIDLPMEIPLSS